MKNALLNILVVLLFVVMLGAALWANYTGTKKIILKKEIQRIEQLELRVEALEKRIENK